jgi:hypothetical protein
MFNVTQPSKIITVITNKGIYRLNKIELFYLVLDIKYFWNINILFSIKLFLHF